MREPVPKPSGVSQINFVLRELRKLGGKSPRGVGGSRSRGSLVEAGDKILNFGAARREGSPFGERPREPTEFGYGDLNPGK